VKGRNVIRTNGFGVIKEMARKSNCGTTLRQAKNPRVWKSFSGGGGSGHIAGLCGGRPLVKADSAPGQASLVLS
jgi:hypothetical protein